VKKIWVLLIVLTLAPALKAGVRYFIWRPHKAWQCSDSPLAGLAASQKAFYRVTETCKSDQYGAYKVIKVVCKRTQDTKVSQLFMIKLGLQETLIP
jgi:hypothetical protein